jgi:hypothetical protein
MELVRIFQNADRATNSRITEGVFHHYFAELKCLVSPSDVSALFLKYAKVQQQQQASSAASQQSSSLSQQSLSSSSEPTLDVLRFVTTMVPGAHIRETQHDPVPTTAERARPSKVKSNVWF